MTKTEAFVHDWPVEVDKDDAIGGALDHHILRFNVHLHDTRLEERDFGINNADQHIEMPWLRW